MSEEELPADEVVERVMQKGREKMGLDRRDTDDFAERLANLVFSDSESSSSSSAASSSPSRSSAESSCRSQVTSSTKPPEGAVSSRSDF